MMIINVCLHYRRAACFSFVTTGEAAQELSKLACCCQEPPELQKRMNSENNHTSVPIKEKYREQMKLAT